MVQKIIVLKGLVDRSGSMASMGDVPKNAVIDLINERKAETDSDTKILISLVSFDDVAENITEQFVDISLLQIDNSQIEQKLVPRGSTCLIDIAIKELEKLQTQISVVQEQATEITGIFYVFTDGFDNCSEKSPKDLNFEIKKARESGIVCIFAACNQDAIQSGDVYGFNPQTCLNVGVESAGNAFHTISSAVNRAVSGQNVEFTPVERLASAPPPYSSAHRY